MNSLLLFCQRLGKLVLDFVFPPFCVACGRQGDWLCADCRAKIEPLGGQVCLSCRQAEAAELICEACRSRSPIQGVITTGRYDGVIKKAIHSFKYKYASVLADPLAELMAAAWHQSHLASLPADSLILFPVPLHKSRLNERGFNQSLLLAQRLSDLAGGLMIGAGLKRIDDTGHQMQLARGQRLSNLEDAFVYQGDSLAGRTVILVDDVCTTGATLFECARVLAEHSPQAIWALVLAHGG